MEQISIRLVDCLAAAIRDFQTVFEIAVLVEEAPVGFPLVVFGVEPVLPWLVKSFEPSRHNPQVNMHTYSGIASDAGNCYFGGYRKSIAGAAIDPYGVEERQFAAGIEKDLPEKRGTVVQGIAHPAFHKGVEVVDAGHGPIGFARAAVRGICGYSTIVSTF